MAAEDLKNKKRKTAPETEPKPKKQKKTDGAAVGTRKSPRAQKSAVAPLDSLPATSKASRPRAEDFMSDDETPAKAAKKSKKSKTAAPADEEAVEAEKPKKKSKKVTETAVETVVEPEASKSKAKKGKKEASVVKETVTVTEEKSAVADKKSKAKKHKKEAPMEKVEVEEVAETSDGDAEEELDDQTAALLKGFESDRDESDEEKDGEFDEKAVSVPELSKKQRKALEKVRHDSEPGVIFLGQVFSSYSLDYANKFSRVPHGFFEPQMKKYFGQFGEVTRLRLSRNKKTGASKHYAFIEFANGEVADIVAKTMHNYLMFGHILQCKTIPAEQVHPELFKGANERFKVDPRNKKAGLAMVRGAERGQWEKRVARENQNRAKKAKALKEEFDYDFSAPAVMAVEDVPKQIDTSADAEEQLQLEAPVAEVTDIVEVESKPGQVTVTETVKVKKGKKGTKADTNGAAKTEEPAPASKAKKDKKRKSDVSVAVSEPEAVADISAPTAKKAKKAKKAKA